MEACGSCACVGASWVRGRAARRAHDGSSLDGVRGACRAATGMAGSASGGAAMWAARAGSQRARAGRRRAGRRARAATTPGQPRCGVRCGGRRSPSRSHAAAALVGDCTQASAAEAAAARVAALVDAGAWFHVVGRWDPWLEGALEGGLRVVVVDVGGVEGDAEGRPVAAKRILAELVCE